MKCGFARPLLLGFAFALMTTAALAQVEPRYKGLPNFHQVAPNLYRGGQPRADGTKKLLDLGIRTILDLRGSGDRSRAEEAEARTLGLRYYNVELSNIGRPNPARIEQALAIINDPQNWPVFVHCRRGSDRTGAVIACYRISRNQWTLDRALAEAKRYGMGWIEFRMRGFITDYNRALTSSNSQPATATAH
jgi:protein tyrosine/serine phosphatase